jgi:hypothetical protein
MVEHNRHRCRNYDSLLRRDQIRTQRLHVPDGWSALRSISSSFSPATALLGRIEDGSIGITILLLACLRIDDLRPCVLNRATEFDYPRLASRWLVDTGSEYGNSVSSECVQCSLGMFLAPLIQVATYLRKSVDRKDFFPSPHPLRCPQEHYHRPCLYRDLEHGSDCNASGGIYGRDRWLVILFIWR